MWDMWGEVWRLLVVVLMVRSIKLGRLGSALCLWLSKRIHRTTVSVLLDSKVNKKTSYWYCLSLYYYYKRMRNSVAYWCRDFVVNRRKALLANRLALCYDSWTSRDSLTYNFPKVLGFDWLPGPRWARSWSRWFS